MKSLYIAALFSTSSLITPVFAAEIDFNSDVSQVIVYPRGAQVTRVAKGQVSAGDHVIIVDDLPGQIVANSVRVEGRSVSALEIGSIDVRQEYLNGKDQSDARKQIEAKIEALNDEVSQIAQSINDADMQRAMLRGLAGQAVLPRKGDNGAIVISADELNSLLGLTADKLAQISQTIAKARIQQRSLGKEIETLQKKLQELAPSQELRTIVAINLTSSAQADAEFSVRYNVNEAGWAPIYDAKLNLGEKGQDSNVKLIKKASVRQGTTEDWSDVNLTLSTARPTSNTQAPILRPYLLRERKPVVVESRRKKSRESGALESLALPAPAASPQSDTLIGRAFVAPKKAEFKPVAVEFAGFLAEYKISGTVSVSNAGVKKNVTIGVSELPVKLAVHAIPKLDSAAYLTASFKVVGKSPLLPGTVTLSRDGTFLGKARLPLLNPGEEHSLGFGQDDFVKIERVEVTDKKGESGFISTVNVKEREFATTIRNLHDFAILVNVQDHIPYATHEDIEVEMTNGTTKPTHENVEKKRGVLAWEQRIEPNGEQVINFGYKVSWPKDMKITPIR